MKKTAIRKELTNFGVCIGFLSLPLIIYLMSLLIEFMSMMLINKSILRGMMFTICGLMNLCCVVIFVFICHLLIEKFKTYKTTT